MQALQQMGCDEMQGFYFSRPVDAEAATRLLRDFRPSRVSHGNTGAPAAS